MSRNHSRPVLASLALLPLLVAGAVQAGSPAFAKPARLPDLKVSSVVTKAATVEPGDRFAVTGTVTNAGKGKARPSKVRLYLSADKARGGDLAIAATRRVPALAAGRKAAFRLHAAVPASATDGAYFVLACVDATGRDARKGNDCRVSTARVTVRAPWKGTLTGALTFDKGFTRSDEETQETSSDHATVQVKINVDDTIAGWGAFRNVGSTYGYTGRYHRVDTSSTCVVEAKGTSDGGGALVQKGDPFEDDLLGDFGRTDHTEFDLVIGLRNENKVTTTYTPVGEFGCDIPTKVEGPRARRNLNEIEFHQVSRTGRTVTYRIAEVLGSGSTKTEWTSVTGTLTLSLR